MKVFKQSDSLRSALSDLSADQASFLTPIGVVPGVL